uniref:class I adenylate-forming enzyme family protein n=1 Tax=Shimia sp. TaxID=1954381 RepID=UPI0035663C82
TALVALLRRGISIVVLPADGAAEAPPFCAAVFDTARMEAGPLPGSAGAAATKPPPQAEATAREPRIYVATSGSTGAPKWVVYSRAGLILNADGVRERMRISRDDCVLVSTPLAHMFGLGGGLLPALLAGASLRVTRGGDPLSILAAERDCEPTVAFLIPGQCRALLPLRRDARRYRVVVVGVGRLSEDFAARFEKMHGPVVAMYGSTELGAVVGGHPDAEPERRHRFIGPPLKSARVFVEADQTDGQGRAIGPVMVEQAAGYLGYGDATGQLIAPAPARQATGDLGTLGAAGELDILGRADDRIRRDGYWVLTSEVEACLSDAASLAEAAVIASGETRRGAGLVAFVVMAPGAVFETAGLMQHCRDRLPGHMVPDRIVPLARFERLASGKIDLQALAARAEDTGFAAEGSAAEGSPEEDRQ